VGLLLSCISSPTGKLLLELERELLNSMGENVVGLSEVSVKLSKAIS
jgi:hypothetical protein